MSLCGSTVASAVLLPGGSGRSSWCCWCAAGGSRLLGPGCGCTAGCDTGRCHCAPPASGPAVARLALRTRTLPRALGTQTHTQQGQRSQCTRVLYLFVILSCLFNQHYLRRVTPNIHHGSIKRLNKLPKLIDEKPLKTCFSSMIKWIYVWHEHKLNIYVFIYVLLWTKSLWR